jgi:hypothetical protein
MIKFIGAVIEDVAELVILGLFIWFILILAIVFAG